MVYLQKFKKSKRDSKINLKKKVFLINKLFANNKIYGKIKQIIFLENIIRLKYIYKIEIITYKNERKGGYARPVNTKMYVKRTRKSIG